MQTPRLNHLEHPVRPAEAPRAAEPAAPPPEEKVREAEVQESASSRNTGTKRKAKLRVQEVEGQKVRGPEVQEIIVSVREVVARPLRPRSGRTGAEPDEGKDL